MDDIVACFLRENNFIFYADVRYRHSISDLVKNKADKCGIYILRFDDDTFYVGQSVDFCRRLLQHKKQWNDITDIWFKKIHKKELNVVELATIQDMEEITRIRNISNSSHAPLRTSDLDEIIPQYRQKEWLEQDFSEFSSRLRIQDEIQRAKYIKRTEGILDGNKFSLAIPVIKKYIQKCIHKPYLTEMTYWGLSFPFEKHNEFIILTRVNLRFQEVFTVIYNTISKK